MNLYGLAKSLVESVTKNEVESFLQSHGYEIKPKGNKLNVLVQIPDGEKKNEYRSMMLNQILELLKNKMPDKNPQFNADPRLSSLGGIVFMDSPVSIVVKDIGMQGEKSAGIKNELTLASVVQRNIEKYGKTTITFKDPRGNTMQIRDCTGVEVAGRYTSGGKKADAVFTSASGSLPVSIKQVDADGWQSADSTFGNRARNMIDKLVQDGHVELQQVGERKLKYKTVPVYSLNKEIVTEPTPEEVNRAMFGTDLNPKGGVVIQTFKPEHFINKGKTITVDCHAVIAKPSDVPESHRMVWLLRNDSTRNCGSLGLAGIRPLGVTLTRGIGKKGNKDVILVDVNGNVVDNKKTTI